MLFTYSLMYYINILHVFNVSCSLQCTCGYSQARYIEESPIRLSIKDFGEYVSVLSNPSPILGAEVTSRKRSSVTENILKQNDVTKQPLVLVPQ